MKVCEPTFRCDRSPNSCAGTYPARVSSLLHDTKFVGSEVELSFAFGNFFLDKTPYSFTSPVVLLSAGVGLTPVLSMLNTLVGAHIQAEHRARRPVTWIQGLRSPADDPFTKHIRNLAKDYPEQLKIVFFYSRPTNVQIDAFGKDEFMGHAVIKEFLHPRNNDPTLVSQMDPVVGLDRTGQVHHGSQRSGLRSILRCIVKEAQLILLQASIYR